MLLVYQGKIRRDWHKTINTPDSFSLLLLEQDRLQIFHQELLDNAYASKIESLNMVRKFSVRFNQLIVFFLSFHFTLSALPTGYLLPLSPFPCPSQTRTWVIIHVATLGTWASHVHLVSLGQTQILLMARRYLAYKYTIFCLPSSYYTLPLLHPIPTLLGLYHFVLIHLTSM